MAGFLGILVTISLVWGAQGDVGVCEDGSSKLIRHDALKLNRLELDFDQRFTWQATRGTQELLISHGDEATVTVTDYGNTTAKITARGSEFSAGGDTAGLHTRLSLLLAVAFLVADGRKFLLLIALLMCVFASGLAQLPECHRADFVHLLIPGSLVDEVCQRGECWPVICKLHFTSEYSNLPSNNELVFSDNKCTVRRPDDWQQWLDFYFGPNSTESLFGDYDDDGLVNILEYYGRAAFDNSYVVFSNGTRIDVTNSSQEVPATPQGQSRRKRSLFVNQFPGSDPTNPDSDGDLLQDGFETANSMDATVFDETEGDVDTDGLNNLNEQIYHTDPRNPDSDGDGVADGDEVSDGGDPRNPTDEGQTPPGSQTALVRLTVGDHSGSHSERYILHVGGISHQSPGYGLVGSGTYSYKAGRYPITMEHTGSTLSPPDYDYTATVVKTSGDAKVTIEDPLGMLGLHHESHTFYASGKSATLVVEDECPEDGEGSEECKCSRLTTCVECKGNDCYWDPSTRSCSSSLSFGAIAGFGECYCEKCRVWYEQELTDRAWRDEVNRQFLCPCRATFNNGVNPVGDTNVEWSTDSACNGGGNCGYHPGAQGCVRSADTTASGAAQQCCYGADGNILAPGHPGAGTPDKTAGKWNSVVGHYFDDVVTYEWCCEDCEEPNSCDRYMEVRGGDTSHCNQAVP